MTNSTEVKAGDHVYVRRSLRYTHHGVAVSATEVIHFNGEPRCKRGATIRRDSLEDFAAGGEVQVRPYGARLSAHAIVQRAESKLGESGYHLFKNNCEHFARWCSTGKERSQQVDGAKSVGGAGAVTTAGVGGTVYVVSAAGFTGTSGAGIMSGLAAIGVGGATGGIMTLAAAPAAAAVGLVCIGLRDHDDLPDEDRSARRLGRRAAVGGAALSTAAVVPTVSFLGTAGLSAAGISSGLATLGGLAGGSVLAGTSAMLAGTMVIAAAPVVATCGVGVGTYAVAKKLRRPSKSNDVETLS